MNDEQKARVIANCEIIAKALREGLQLQWRRRDLAGGWKDDDGFPACHYEYEYRIKPEPRTIWVNEYGTWLESFLDSDTARRVGSGASRIAVEYREVVK
jgi:hypothetical protein